MKKFIAILLTLIFAFSCFSILGIGTVSAESQETGQIIMESDFDDSDGTDWYVSHNNVVFGEENGDDYARVTISNEAKGSGLASPSFNLVTGNEYELTYYMRIPEGSSSYMIGTTYYAPSVSLYMPKVTEAGVKVTNITQTGTAENSNNFYAYSHNDKADASKSWARRNTFPMEVEVDGYNVRSKKGGSGFAWSEQSSYFGGKVVNEVFAEWTKVTAKFTAVANTEGEKSQITALSFSFLDYKASGSLIFDIKDVKLVETVKEEPKNVILESDFDNTDGTNWSATKSNVEFLGDYARVNSSASQSGASLVSPKFNLIPGNDYELSFKLRIPKDLSNSYLNGETFYAPEVYIYDPTYTTSTRPTITADINTNNLYAYSYTDKNNADASWKRRATFKAEWQIGDYGAFTKSKYSFMPKEDQKTLLGATTDARDAYAEWTTITAKFSAVANEDGETSQSVALGFTIRGLKAAGYIFDVKDVELVEKVNVTTEEPEGTVIPSGYTDYDIKYLKGMYKTQGRTSIINNMLMIDYTASGMEFSANCEGDVYLTFNTSKVAGTDEGGCYFTVIVDGVKQPRDFCRITSTGDTIFAIANDLPKGIHTFEIYRQTEIERAVVAVKSIALKSGSAFELAPTNRDLYIEFIGDSLSTAYGNVTLGADIKNGTYKYSEAPLHQDGTMGFTYLTARALGADWSVVAQQGRGAKYGFSSENLQDIYPKLRYNRDKNTNYDFAREPDIVVIGCGTNDTRTYNKSQYTDPVATLDDVKQGYKELLALVREKNPNAKIVWIHNMIDDEPSTMVPDVMEEAGGEFAGYYAVEVIRDTEVKGTNGHPYYDYHEALAEDLAPKLENILEQNDFETGDVDDDGNLNLNDLVLTAQYVAEWENLDIAKKLAVDVNGDKVADLTDVNHLAQYLAGWDVKLGAKLDYTRGINGVVDKTLATYTSASTGLKMQYTLLMPKDYDETKEYPVLLFLHGADAKGIGNDRPIQKLEPFYDTDAETMSEAIVLIPQCPANKVTDDNGNTKIDFRPTIGYYSSFWWHFTDDGKGALNIAMELLENEVLSKYNCDSDRFYVMGLSMGGQGTWKVTEKYADKVAAAVPICGANRELGNIDVESDQFEDATLMKDIPIWIYHDKEDNLVNISISQIRYENLIAAGNTNVKFTISEGYGHNAWEVAQADAEMIKWLFDQNLKNR